MALDTPGNCPACGHQFDATEPIDGSEALPGPGDVTLCIKCGEVLEFDEQMNLKRSDDRSPEVLKAQRMIRRIHREMN